MGWSVHLFLALGGGAGALARYAVYRALAPAASGALPWATISVNVVGSILFGVIATLAAEPDAMAPRTRIALLTGFLGAFTTFSTFAYESAELLRLGFVGRALLNAALQNVGALLGVFAGFAVGRALQT